PREAPPAGGRIASQNRLSLRPAHFRSGAYWLCSGRLRPGSVGRGISHGAGRNRYARGGILADECSPSALHAALPTGKTRAALFSREPLSRDVEGAYRSEE